MRLTQFLKHGAWIAALCILAMLVRLPSQAQASPTLPSVQMLDGTFADHNLPTDGSTVTLVSIPFNVTSTAKLQATSLIDVQFGGGGCCGQGGPIITETCSLLLDESTHLFTSTWSTNSSLPASFSMTATDSGVAAGSHTLAVQCTGSATGPTSEIVLVRSGGTSLIVVSGV